MTIPLKYEDIAASLEVANRAKEIAVSLSVELKAELDAALAREAALREELAKFKAGCVDLSSQVRDLEHKMDYYKGEGMRADGLQQRLTVAEQLLRNAKFLIEHSSYRICGASALIFGIDAALKPAAEGEGS